MPKIRCIELTEDQRVALELGYRSGRPGVFSRRCHLILLKSEERTSKEVGAIVKMHEISVNSWLDRYESEGLKTKGGRGRKQILNLETDAATVRKAIEQERQRLSQAKQVLEGELNKQFSSKTLRRFLKNLSTYGSEFV
jgi:transposase